MYEIKVKINGTEISVKTPSLYGARDLFSGTLGFKFILENGVKLDGTQTGYGIGGQVVDNTKNAPKGSKDHDMLVVKNDGTFFPTDDETKLYKAILKVWAKKRMDILNSHGYVCGARDIQTSLVK